MEIAFVYDAVYPFVKGGAERRYYEFGRRLASRGHAVHFVGWQYWDGAPVQERDDGTWLHGVGTPRALHDRHGRRMFREAIAFAVRCLPTVARLPRGVVDCSSVPYAPALLLSPLTRRNGHRLVVSWHEYLDDRWSDYAGRRAIIARQTERRAARCGAMRIAVSEFTRARLPAGPPTTVVPNGIDCGAMLKIRAAGASDVISVGRLVPHKRVDLLLRALAQMPGVTANIVGDGPQRFELERLSVALELGERVTFLGRVDSDEEVARLVKGARCLALTSEQEGFGMTVIEAMALGTPPVVVTSAASAAAGLVTHGRDGLVVTEAPDSVALALQSVVGDGELRARMSSNAIASARAYDWNALTDRLIDSYARMAGSIVPARQRIHGEQAA